MRCDITSVAAHMRLFMPWCKGGINLPAVRDLDDISRNYSPSPTLDW